jgi:hypothetical protein
MGVLEARQEATRRWTAERDERLEAAAAALAEKQAAEAEQERNADRDRRREEARRDARLNYVQKHQASGASGESALKANAAETAFNVALADPSSSVQTLFSAWSAYQGAAAAHRIVFSRFITYSRMAANPGPQDPLGAVDNTVIPPFSEVLERVLATRLASAVRAVPNEGAFYEKATEAGEAAAKAVQP